MLFIDARNIYRQIDRAHRDFTPEQIDFISGIVRRYRNEEQVHYKVAAEPDVEYSTNGSAVTQPDDMGDIFPDEEYQDIPGLCKVATVEEIIEQGWSLNPGRYVGVAEREEDDVDFKKRMSLLRDELLELSNESQKLESDIMDNINSFLGKYTYGKN